MIYNENPYRTFHIRHMSYLFYPIFGALIATVAGTLTSLICKEKFENDMNPMLFSPFVRKFLHVRRPSEDRRSCVSHTFDKKDTQL